LTPKSNRKTIITFDRNITYNKTDAKHKFGVHEIKIGQPKRLFDLNGLTGFFLAYFIANIQSYSQLKIVLLFSHFKGKNSQLKVTVKKKRLNKKFYNL
jgi:hypothetical protein